MLRPAGEVGVWRVQGVWEGCSKAAKKGESLTGWLKGLGSEGRMCRWAIIACSRSLSLASCGEGEEAGSGQGLYLEAGRSSSSSISHQTP